MMGPGFAAHALMPTFVTLVAICIGIGVGLTLLFGWGVPWLWEHVTISIK